MDTVLLDRILEVMTQEEKESVLSRLKTDPASSPCDAAENWI